MMISFVYGVRNADVQRLRNSIESLYTLDFEFSIEVIVVDYASELNYSECYSDLCNSLGFTLIKHMGSPHWSRARALNIGVEACTGNYIFFSDVDMLYTKAFAFNVTNHVNRGINAYFQVAYLDVKGGLISLSSEDAQGILLVDRSAFLTVGGFDNFYSFWGKEDNDLISRLREAGYIVEHSKPSDPIKHVWHPAFHSDHKKMPKGWRRLVGDYTRQKHELTMALEGGEREFHSTGGILYLEYLLGRLLQYILDFDGFGVVLYYTPWYIVESSHAFKLLCKFNKYFKLIGLELTSSDFDLQSIWDYRDIVVRVLEHKDRVKYKYDILDGFLVIELSSDL